MDRAFRYVSECRARKSIYHGEPPKAGRFVWDLWDHSGVGFREGSLRASSCNFTTKVLILSQFYIDPYESNILAYIRAGRRSFIKPKITLYTNSVCPYSLETVTTRPISQDPRQKTSLPTPMVQPSIAIYSVDSCCETFKVALNAWLAGCRASM